MNDRDSRAIFARPIGLLIIITASIFGSAVLVHLFLSLFPHLSLEKYTFLDAGLLAAVLFPVMYYLVFEPLKSDIEELKRSEEALQMSEARYRSLVESTDDSIYIVNRKCEYLFMNAKHRTRLGLLDQEYAGKSYGEFHTAEETRVFGEKVIKVFETGVPLPHEHRSRRDGKYFLRTLSPIRGVRTGIVGVSVVSKNITDLKQ
jgi:PAS domain S-box-containing protein